MRLLTTYDRVLCLGAVLLWAGPLCAQPPVEFNRDIRPILSDKCFQCHGPDSATREAELRLDREEAAKADRGGYQVIRPGDAPRSVLIERIFSDDPDTRMPPANSGHALSEDEKALLKRWIEAGAEWQPHWSFVAPRRPPLPLVRQTDWPRNGIDHFILARLEAEGLSPSETATRERLIRRVTLDLTGRPPTLSEVDAYLADASPAAYERVVDRLLHSPAYGEQMARMWLDAARYADTDGYQNDGPREMWPWRDWVIDAYNSGMRFDQFTIEQLAGDLLPEPTLAQRIATGFNRNHRYNSEAGLVLEEFLLENAVDRVDTTSTVWMGLTMGCARCHAHKFDPISHEEYYQLIAFFDNVPESGRAVKFGNSEPYIPAPNREQRGELRELDRKVEEAQGKLEAAEVRISKALAKWEATRVEAAGAEGGKQEPPVVARGLTARFTFETDIKDVKAETGELAFAAGPLGRAALLDGESQWALGKVGDVACQRRSSITFWLKPEEVKQGVIISRQADNTRRPGVAVELREGRLQFYIITRWVAGVGAVETVEPLAAGEWVHVALTNDGSQSARGMSILLNGKRVPTRLLYNTNSNTGGTAKEMVLRIGGGVHGARYRGRIDELRFYNRTLWDDEIALLATPTSVDDILSLTQTERDPAQSALVRAWFLEHAAPGPLRRLEAGYFTARADRLQFQDALPTTMVMVETEPPTATHIRIRGDYKSLGERVEPQVPAVLPAVPAGQPRNRLGLARWLVSGEHPLTARVAVNRYWQKYFGTGLVKTSADFGMQGELPSHPQLLDWLATEFVRTGWDVKGMQKLIVMSATYRQSSRVRDDRDPENRLLARGPRLRLPAHVLRDQALVFSELLVPVVGGPSVYPYQPANLWEEMSNMKYKQSQGSDLYRRSLYTFWKRTIAPPGLSVLDAADRESCSVLPKRTNTPLQALTLLNETLFVEAARHLGERMIREGGDAPVEFAFRLVTARHPQPHELELLQAARSDYLAEFRANSAAAAKLIRVGDSEPPEDVDPVELAANTTLANVLLNLDEVLNKE